MTVSGVTIGSGRGVDIWPNGDRYEGEWADGAPNGRGTYSFGDRVWYEGDFRAGQLSVHGIIM